MDGTCLYEERWGRVLTQLENISTKVCSHIQQGEEKGGFRDRLIIIEQEVAALRKSVWKIGITSGLIGALIGNTAPEVIYTLGKWIIGK